MYATNRQVPTISAGLPIWPADMGRCLSCLGLRRIELSGPRVSVGGAVDNDLAEVTGGAHHPEGVGELLELEFGSDDGTDFMGL